MIKGSESMSRSQVLRERLHRIAYDYDPIYHLKLIEALRAEHPHSVRPMTDRSSNLRFNCVMYALDAHEDQLLINLVLRCPYEVHPSTAFAQFLIDKGHLVECSAADGTTLVVYLKDDKIKHVGRLVAGNRVVSKWGVGHLYEHDFMEVPSSYGDTIRFFRRHGEKPIADLFRAFAEANGVELPVE